jgi:hypothetical protein
MPTATRREFLAALAAPALLRRVERTKYPGYVEMWGPDGEHVRKPLTSDQCDYIVRAIQTRFR